MAPVDDKSISVADYFRLHANIKLKFPDNICIEVYKLWFQLILIFFSFFRRTATGALIPIKLCEVLPGQIMRKQIPADKTTDVVEFSQMNPAQTLASIRTGLQVGDIIVTNVYSSYQAFRYSNMNKTNTFELLA